jgi:enoyl-CoA hydratase
MRTFEHLETDFHDHVLRVWLRRPPVNAVDQAMYEEIRQLFANLDEHFDDVRVVLLQGRGPHFCAGNDLAEFSDLTPENGRERMWRIRECFAAIHNCPVPVIGAVHGVAVGTGIALIASCDFVIAASDARFGLTEIAVGVMGGASHLARLVPQPLVRRMFFTGELVGAEVLAGVGGVVEVVDPAELEAAAMAVARRVSRYSPTALRMAKAGLNRVEGMDVRTGYEFEQELTVALSGHPDSKASLAALRDEDAPVFASADPTPRHLPRR